MKIKKIGILKEKHISKNSIIPTLKDSGIKCVCSDLARILGIDYDEKTGNGSYWYDGLPVVDKKGNSKIAMKFIGKDGGSNTVFADKKNVGVRIAIPFNNIEDFKLSEIDSLVVEYPLFVIGGVVGKTIEKLFETKSKLVFKTGRFHDINNELYEEYEVLGIKFIKMEHNTSGKILTDGTLTELDKPIFMRVAPIPFSVDKDAQMLYSSIIITVPNTNNECVEFEKSNLYKYLNGGFLKSINNELEHKEPSKVFNEDTIKYNRYNFDFSEFTEEDIIETCINSRIAVYLHGKTGTGKTERMLSLDKNLELVDFGCTSADGFTGIVAKDFETKKLCLYDPYWYTNLKKKCEEHPELLHILFLEEFQNANKEVQKVAYEVTLNRSLTNSGFRLELPDNAVVCAAGNEADESKVSTAMSAPLFGRFAHVYIDTDSEKWLKWALRRKQQNKTLTYKTYKQPDTIHPAIIDFIQAYGDSVLTTPFDGKTPNADPRKWAMASRALYECNNPNVLRAFVGKELTDSFIKFCKLNLITIDDVLNDRVSPEDVPTDPTVMWNTILILSKVDDENFDKVRDFVSKLNNEFLAMFEYEWSKDNEERIMRLFGKTVEGYSKKLSLNENK